MPTKIPVNILVSDFQVMEKEHWKYDSNTSKGHVDCSGAFVYAYKLHGLSIYHGSNRIAREYVVELIPYKEAKSKGLIKPGMAAFKIRKPGDKLYDLPAEYKKGGSHYNGDLNDYYHIGLVDEDINYVLNAQSKSTGFVRSKITQNWSHVALLKDVDYSKNGGSIPVNTGKKAIVTAPSGNTVNMRKNTSTDSAIIMKVPVGSEITVTDDLGTWCYITYKGKSGYMVSNYIEYKDAPVDSNPVDDSIIVDKDVLKSLYNTAISLANEISNLLGNKG